MNIEKRPSLKLVKQDLDGFLRLVGDRRPELDVNSLALDLRKLARREAADYLFLVRREKSYLFPLEDVCERDSYAYLCWTAYTLLPDVPVDAFYLRASDASHGAKGAVVLLDYAASAADVERAAALSPEERAGHLRQLTRHWRDYARICSTVEMMAAIGGDVGWT